jgi:hypothetical protein
MLKLTGTQTDAVYVSEIWCKQQPFNCKSRFLQESALIIPFTYDVDLSWISEGYLPSTKASLLYNAPPDSLVVVWYSSTESYLVRLLGDAYIERPSHYISSTSRECLHSRLDENCITCKKSVKALIPSIKSAEIKKEIKLMRYLQPFNCLKRDIEHIGRIEDSFAFGNKHSGKRRLFFV